MSGYTGHSSIEHGALDAGVDFLPKPFVPKVLFERVRTALNSKPKIRRILVVDDEPAMRDLLNELLADSGFKVSVASGGREAREYVHAEPVDLIITDLMMEEEEGIELIRSLRREYPELKIIAMSGAFGSDLLTAARALGANATLAKPISQASLLRAIEAL